ncbi:MAG: formylglycine-generating enzyme family protein [Planctomycetaceae bacterium]
MPEIESNLQRNRLAQAREKLNELQKLAPAADPEMGRLRDELAAKQRAEDAQALATQIQTHLDGKQYVLAMRDLEQFRRLDPENSEVNRLWEEIPPEHRESGSANVYRPSLGFWVGGLGVSGVLALVLVRNRRGLSVRLRARTQSLARRMNRLTGTGNVIEVTATSRSAKQAGSQRPHGERFENSVGMTLSFISPGEGTLGSYESELGREPSEFLRRIVRRSSGYYCGVTPVTRRQWKAIMQTEPWGTGWGIGTSDAVPATGVSWDQAVAFCDSLSQREGKRYRLLTEEEWEFACRAGSTTRYFYGDDPTGTKLREFAWFQGTPVGDGVQPVTLLKPNAWGLHDFLGGVWEWCLDVYQSPDGKLAADNQLRAVRGGAWTSTADQCRCATRSSRHRTHSDDDLGFRVCCEETVA